METNTFGPSLAALAVEEQKMADFASSMAMQAQAMCGDIATGLNSLASGQHNLAEYANKLSLQAQGLIIQGVSSDLVQSAPHGEGSFFITGLTIFVLACFVGYHVVWRVTPALHSPLMAVTNAVSSVIIVGALLAAGPVGLAMFKWYGLGAVVLASVNIFGGFIVTQRMLLMYRKKGK